MIHHSYLKHSLTKAIGLLSFWILGMMMSCKQGVQPIQNQSIQAADILENPAYKGISYGGYRYNTREIQPTTDEIIKDLKILNALGFRIIRTYNVHFEFAHNVLKAISLLKKQNPEFEMYVMLGAWINCKDAWTDHPDHDKEDYGSL